MESGIIYELGGAACRGGSLHASCAVLGPIRALGLPSWPCMLRNPPQPGSHSCPRGSGLAFTGGWICSFRVSRKGRHAFLLLLEHPRARASIPGFSPTLHLGLNKALALGQSGVTTSVLHLRQWDLRDQKGTVQGLSGSGRGVQVLHLLGGVLLRVDTRLSLGTGDFRYFHARIAQAPVGIPTP